MKRPIRQLIACAVVGLCALQARAEEALNALLPYDTLAFAELNPTSGTRTGKESALLDLGVAAMQSMGLVSHQAGVAGDILSLASIAGRRHSCLALLDADLAASPNNELECRSVQLVWIIDTGGRPREMIDRLTGVLSHVSTRTTARQSVKQTAEQKRKYVEFHDTTWPEWLTLDWTQRGSYFILGIGSGAMEHYLADRPVGGVPWGAVVAEVDKQAGRQGSTGAMLARIYVTPQGFRERFPAAMKQTLLGRLFETLDLGTADAALFSARSQGREISMDSGVVSRGEASVTPWTVPPGSVSPALLNAVPADASAYLVLKVQWQELYERTLALVDAMLPGESSEPLEKVISRFAEQQQVDVRRDILAHLQPLVLVHNSPPHPLRLPLMVTTVAAAKPADQAQVRTALGTLLDAASAVLDRRAGGKGGTPPPAETDFTHLRLRRDGDGVRYLQFGVVGPGWRWVGNRLVFSWSPGAVRENLPRLPAIPAEAFTARASGEKNP